MKRTLEEGSEEQSKKLKIAQDKNPLSPYCDEESSVGISKYVDVILNGDSLDISLPPFTGIMKQRFSDFIVHEIDRNGKVIYLTSTEIPESIKDKRSKDIDLDPEAKKENERKGIEEFKSIISDQTIVAGIEDFLQKHQETEDSLVEIVKQRKKIEEADVPTHLIKENDKNNRSKIHNIIKEHFSHVMVSDTLNKDNDQYVRLRYQFQSFTLQTLFLNNQNNSKAKKREKRDNKKKGGRREQNNPATQSYFDPRQFAWPKERPNYIQFVLYKENSETTEIIGEMCRILKLKQKNFQIAGTKDKRGITTQRVTGYQISAEKLMQVNQKCHKMVKVGNFEYVDRPLKLGDLSGNRFTLVLRDLKIPEGSPFSNRNVEDIFRERIEQLNKYGYINYFGMQRFGITYNSVKREYHSDYPTHLLGQHLLKSNWKTLAKIILIAGIQNVRDQRAKQTIIDFTEGKISAEQCYNSLPKFKFNTEKIMLNSYVKTSENDHLAAIQALPMNLLSMYIHAYQSLVYNHMVSLRIEKYGLKVVVGDIVVSRSELKSCEDPKLTFESPITRIETEEQAQKYNIEDVVMSIPGYDIQFPSTEFVNKETYYKFMLENGGITEEDYKKHLSQYRTFGAYRFMIEKAKDIEFEFKDYNPETNKLVETDYDNNITKKPLEQIPCENTKKAAIISFSLNSSNYATMFVRELIRLPSVIDWKWIESNGNPQQQEEQQEQEQTNEDDEVNDEEQSLATEQDHDETNPQEDVIADANMCE
ncbi:tRNA pseudouridine synthase family protein [Naegleria gruberi]|uniref:tRNA pseudouridine synthase family protein n=1 Tax=Naegleria gruberi TaxID=5762 RepID=D2V9Q6_NAEGR|nr:tRNA pseudouridine synthase family protein [Naegleria gruberi]EFC46506.1 tRNA pseudouridine synthase family protein [Naegleria gruberi]|eukprot:XP_002679250.1 tRNA pseudouridine synthase family protein [Naegleria gruberi strain NEG-M]